MDTKRIIEMHVNALDGEKEELRRRFLAELDSLGSEAKSAAQHAGTALPTLAWIETSLARLRELREAHDKAECCRDILHRVARQETLFHNLTRREQAELRTRLTGEVPGRMSLSVRP